MLYELNPDQYHKLRLVFREMGYHLIVESVIVGNSPATVYMDDELQPQAALLRHKDRFYLAGAVTEAFGADLKSLFDQQIFPQGQAEGREAFVMYYAPDGWAGTIERVLENHRSWHGQRGYYRLNTLEAEWGAPLPADMMIYRIDEQLLSQTHLNHLDEVIEEIQSERYSVADFLAKSFGFCAVAGDDIAGLCTSEFNTGSCCEVGIMTMEAYQRRGVATALACALADHARANGIAEIGWDCWAGNFASVSTALKVGFRHILDYPAYVGGYTPNETTDG